MRNRNETVHDSKSEKPPTNAVHHHQTCDHEDGVPVELQGRAVPGEPAAPPAAPHAHANHGGQAEAQAQQVAHVEDDDGPHRGALGRLER